MQLIYFAHGGVDHATAGEAAAHQNATPWFLIIVITLVVIVAAFVVFKFLSAAELPTEDAAKPQAPVKPKLPTADRKETK